MNVSNYDRCFQAVAEQFPFGNYVDALVYYEMKAVVTQLQRIGGNAQGKELLDIGCGPMDKTAILQKLGYSCSSIDDLSDPWHLLMNHQEVICAFAKRMGINFVHQKCGGYEIPFEKNYFDIVTCFAVIEHSHDSPSRILNSIGEHLKTGGLALVTMPNSVNLRKRISVLFGRTNYNPVNELFLSCGEYRGHVREYTLSEARHIIERVGFEIIYANTYEYIAQKRLRHIVKVIYLLLGKILPGLRSGLLVIARKPLGWKPKKVNEAEYFRAFPPPVVKIPSKNGSALIFQNM